MTRYTFVLGTKPNGQTVVVYHGPQIDKALGVIEDLKKSNPQKFTEVAAFRRVIAFRRVNL